MSSVSKVRYQQFVNQARGQNVLEVHVNRQDRKNEVVIHYNGKAPKKKGSRLTGQWRITRGEKDAAAIDGEIKAFLEMARKHFFVHRGEGLEDQKFADAKQEAEAKPIIADKE